MQNAPKQNVLQTVRGTRDFQGELYYRKQGFYEYAQTVAEYYGFKPIETPIMEHQSVFLKGVGEHTDIAEKEMYSFETAGGDALSLRPEGTAGIMRSYIEHGMGSMPQPVKLYYGGPFFRHERPQKGRYRQFYQFGLESIGSLDPILDAQMAHIGYLILKASGQNIKIKINTLGTPEIRKQYLETLQAFYKENVESISAKDQDRVLTNPMRVLDSKEPETVAVNANAPILFDALDETSRKHFEHVLDYLKEANIPFEIDHQLVRGLDYYSHTVFEYVTEISTETTEQTTLALGGGGRYDGLADMMGHNKSVPAVGLGLGVDRILDIANIDTYQPSIKKAPRAFLITQGAQAKIKSYKIIEILREAEIPLAQGREKDGIGAQLGSAESLGIRYALIFGQNEADANTVIVKDMFNRTQEIVPLEELTHYLLHLSI
jgi:histidyl-tRNA synthetase